MDILVFSDNKNIEKCFFTISKSKDFAVQFFRCDDMKKSVKKFSDNGFIYYDISGLEEADINKIVRYLSKLELFEFGIIDPKGIIVDVADQFYNGISDYVGKDLLKDGITLKRMKKTLQFKGDSLEAYNLKMQSVSVKDYILSGKDWNEIKSGQEYSFVFMYIELDKQKELKKMGQDQLNDVIVKFHNYIEHSVSHVNGKVWMWTNFGGIILFPFDGKNCHAIRSSFKLILDNIIIHTEYYDSDIPLSYRIVVHIGNTIYKKRGNTGTIISESVNSIFHLGHKFAKPGKFYITKETFYFAPERLKNYFINVGEFEGREVMEMKISN